MEKTLLCKNCNQQLTGKFCSNCGEKIYTEKDKKISHFLEDGFHFITHFEGKFFTTLKTVFTKPGQLSIDYCSGIRKKYFKPLSFFLVIVVLYLLFPKFEGLNMKFVTYVNKNYNYASYAVPVAKKKLAKLKITGNELAEKYDTKSEKFAKPFLILLIPLTALVLWFFFYFKRKLFFDNFVLAVELNTVFIAIQFLIVPLMDTIFTYLYPPSKFFFEDGNFTPLFILQTSCMLLITAIATKKFYNQNWLLIISKSVLFLEIYMFVIVNLYKKLLYLITMLFI